MTRRNKQEPSRNEANIILVSRSEMKRKMKALQALGEELVKLSPAVLAKFPLKNILRIAITDAQRFSKEAKRRQLQLIGKLMRTIDPEPIQAALNLLNNKHGQQTIKLQKLERLRDQVIVEGDKAIDEVLKKHPSIERQTLRQLARQARKEQKDNKQAKASKEIFKYLRNRNCV
ncbi:ribosome biogenesis factor YjgA [Candidatus Enterovibrio escicola]|uniref:Dual-action ribosomal maturation protein DarP n=1 Tax=Candidatus Enterovibrio escicola TaxID=1927127 RepID=A0A2A5T3B0_9GAMM|nr:ribosome biogenesis factor YjgA [Candidatus Enterovibrio escacola]PCS22649.1 putative alpha helix protein [Candidatus Enterovibrio escacola]